jgi:hypothetical protein
VTPLAVTLPFDGIDIVDSFDDWPASGRRLIIRPHVRLWNRRGPSMSVVDWRRLAGTVIACGWKSRKVDAVQVWQLAL